MATRRTQPYRKRPGRQGGRPLAAQLRGRSFQGTNPQDQERELMKKKKGPTASINRPYLPKPGDGGSRALPTAGSKAAVAGKAESLKTALAKRGRTSKGERGAMAKMQKGTLGSAIKEKGEAVYAPDKAKNTRAKNPRTGLEYRTLTKNGNVFHEYMIDGKRKLFRVKKAPKTTSLPRNNAMGSYGRGARTLK